MNLKYSFKEVDQNMHTHCGKGFTFELDKWHEVGDEERNVFCHSWGFHSARNPLACIDNFGTMGRFFVVEPGGDIDEEDGCLVSTKIRFVKEISFLEVIGFGIKYIVEHPHVDSTSCVTESEIIRDNHSEFVIARGKNPRVMAKKGTIVGILKEKPDSREIEKANLFIIGENGYKANKYYEA